jgi:Na+/melibiose symporter-like transporter
MYSTIYWITRLDYIQGFFIAIAVAAAIGLAFMLISYFVCSDMDEDEQNKVKLKWAKRLAIVAISVGFISVFIPSKEDAILIYAGGKAYEYVKSDTSLQKLPYQTTEYLKLIFQKEIDELKKK